MSEFMFPFLWAPQFYHDDCEVRGYHEAESDFQTFFFPLQQMQDPVEPVGWWLSLWQQQSWSLDFLCVWFYMVSFDMK